MSILPQLEHDLRRAADRRVARTGSATPRHPWRRIGPALAVAACIGAVIIAGGALVLLGHGRVRSPARPVAPAAPANSRAQLLDTLGVLRHPQSAAGRRALGTHSLNDAVPLTPPPSGRTRSAWRPTRVDRSLLRVVPGADGSAVELAPVSDPAARYGLQVAISFPNGSGVLLNPTLTTAIRMHGVTACTPAGLRNVCAIIVPDGVTRVVLGAISAPGQPVAVRTAPCCVSAAVHDNVAAFEIPALTASSRRLPPYLYFVTARTTMVWLDRGRTVVRRPAPLQVTARVNHGQLARPDDAIPSASLCARELASCRLTLAPRQARRRR